MAQSKNCPFRVNTSLNSSDNNVIRRGMFQLTSVLLLPDVVVTIFISIVVLNPNGCFWIVPLLHSVSAVLFFFLYRVSSFRFRLFEITELSSLRMSAPHPTNTDSQCTSLFERHLAQNPFGKRGLPAAKLAPAWLSNAYSCSDPKTEARW